MLCCLRLPMSLQRESFNVAVSVHGEPVFINVAVF